MSDLSTYEKYMERAIDLAERGRFSVCPNPTVGAVLVRDGEIIAEGWHKQYGGPHAEIECMNKARNNGATLQNATLIVTLEPCAHYGKTPPCSDAIIEAGISTVVYGCRDVNSMACGGAQKLAEAGVTVIGPVLEQRCLDLIADFIIWQTTNRPYIYLKLASTLDGRIATRTGHSQWISNEASRTSVHKLRAGIGRAGGAVLVGGGTFRADNPTLISKSDSSGKQPLAAILTSRLPAPNADCNLLRQRPEETIFFVSPATAASKAAENLRKSGCHIIPIGPAINGQPNFQRMFEILRKDYQCYYVLCEGGGFLGVSLLETNFVDEFHLYIAPIILGDNHAHPLFQGRAPLNLDEALSMRFTHMGDSAGDAFLILRPA